MNKRTHEAIRKEKSITRSLEHTNAEKFSAIFHFAQKAAKRAPLLRGVCDLDTEKAEKAETAGGFSTRGLRSGHGKSRNCGNSRRIFNADFSIWTRKKRKLRKKQEDFQRGLGGFDGKCRIWALNVTAKSHHSSVIAAAPITDH